MKLPALQFYVGDWRKDVGVQCLNHHQKGVWLEMLFLMHESEQRGKLILKGKAMTEDQIAHALGLDKQIFKETLSLLLTSGVADLDTETGSIMSRRMVRDEKLRKIRSECGKQGGNPELLKQKRTTKVKVPPNQIPEDEDEDEDEGSLPLGDARGETVAEEIYELYPLKVGRPSAIRAIRTALKKHEAVFLKERTAAYARAVIGSDKRLPNPASWFNDERFNDDPATWAWRNGKQVIEPNYKRVEETGQF